MSEETIAFLLKWQSIAAAILGATFGGFIAFDTAYVVATGARRREEKTASWLLIEELQSIRLFVESLESFDAQMEKAFENLDKLRPTRERWRDSLFKLQKLLEQLSIRPVMSESFEKAMATVAARYQYLTAHLQLVRRNMLAAEAVLRIRIPELDDMQAKAVEVEEEGQSISLGFDTERYNPTDFHRAAQHAERAMYLLNELFLSRWRYFHRLRRKVVIPKADKKYLGREKQSLA